MLYKDEGIIIKLKDLGEADRLVTILTRSHGKDQFVAKGVRKSTTRKSGSIDVAVWAKFSFAKTRSLDIITEVQPLTYHDELKLSLPKLTLVSYLFELIDKFFKDPEQGSDAYPLTASILQFLTSKPEITTLELEKTARYFEAQLLHATGFLRQIDKHTNMTKSEERMYKIIEFMKRMPFEEALKLKLEASDIESLERYLYSQIIDIIEARLKSYNIFKSTINNG